MGLELAKAFITVRADSGKLSGDLGGMRNQVESSMNRMAATIGGILAGIASGVGINALLGRLREAADLATIQIQAEAKLAAVVRATGEAAGFTAGELKKQASALQNVTTVGDESILDLQSALLTFRSVTGDQFERATELTLDLAAVMGTNARSGALQLGKALEDPVRGITALRRAGVSFTEEQKEQIKTLVESGQLQKAQTLILDELEKQVGGVARALADTDPGKLQQFQNTLGDLREELGKQFLPLQIRWAQTQLRIQEAINSVLIPSLSYLSSKLNNLKGIYLQLVESPIAQTFLDIGKSALIGATAIGGLLLAVQAATLIGPALAAGFTLATGPIGLTIAAVTALGAAIVHTTGEGETFSGKMDSIFTTKIPALIDAAAFTFRNFAAIGQIAIINITQEALRLFPMMQTPLAQTAAFFVGTWSGVKAFFGSIISNMIGGLMELKNFAVAIGAAISAAFQSIATGNFTGAARAATDAFINTLANQKDVEAKNAFVEFGKAFQEGRNETLASFQQAGGLGGFLDQERSRLENEIALAEAERDAKLRQSAQEGGPAGGGAGTGIEGEEGSPVAQAVKVEVSRSGFAEFGRSIQDSLLKDNTQQQLLEQSERQTELQKELVEMGKKPVPVGLAAD